MGRNDRRDRVVCIDLWRGVWRARGMVCTPDCLLRRRNAVYSRGNLGFDRGSNRGNMFDRPFPAIYHGRDALLPIPDDHDYACAGVRRLNWSGRFDWFWK